MKTILMKLFIFWNRIRVIMYIPAYCLQKTEKIPSLFYISYKDDIFYVYDSRMAREDFYEEDLVNMFDEYLIDKIKEYE